MRALNHSLIPKGTLLLIGGHESKGEVTGENLKVIKKHSSLSHFEILGMLISNVPRTHHHIEIIVSASNMESDMEKIYKKSFNEVGFTHVGFIKAETKSSKAHADALKRIEKAHAVFFSGGDQERLLSRTNKSALVAAIKRRYFSDKNFIVAGTSAGAMVLPEVIITGGVIGSVLLSGDIKLTTGLDFIRRVIVDTHFIKRGRFARLAHAVIVHPDCLGIGLEEDTALIISKGNRASCIGSGMCILIDGNHLRMSNIRNISAETPIVVDNLKVSILAEGSGYLLKERKFIQKAKS